MRALACWPLILMLPATPAVAETLHDEDGVRLSVTIQAIDRAAAVCRIREERHTAEDYATLKPNDGQPLDVWRVDVEVANYSGRLMDHLIVHAQIESEWPPCDHWDGPEINYGKIVGWTGPLMLLQRTGELTGLQPGEVARETEFLLVWHHEEPTMGRWDINYTFAALRPPAGDPQATPPPDRAAANGERDAATRLPGGIRAAETCAEKEVGESCWSNVVNQPGCFVWNPRKAKDEAALWSGACTNGLAEGAGSMTWSFIDGDGNPSSQVGNGEMRDGKIQGRWTLRFADGAVEEGPFVNGKRTGRWIRRSADGTVAEATFVDGTRNGAWTVRSSDSGSSGSGSSVAGTTSDGCSRQRLIDLGQLTSSIDSGATIQFAGNSMIQIRTVAGGASLRQEADYSVTAKAITYTIRRAIAAVPGEGRSDFPVRNPGPHTEACRVTGDTLHFGDGTWN